MTKIEQALAIVSDKGMTLSQRDLMAIDRLLNDIPLDEVSEAEAIVYEAIELITNSPEYAGDIEV